MGKRAKTHSAVAQQKHWDRLTLKHVENFSRDIIGANSGPFAGNPSKEGRQKTLLQHDDWIRADLKSCFFDEEGIHAPTESRLKGLPFFGTCDFLCHVLATWRLQSAHVNDDTRYMRLSGAL